MEPEEEEEALNALKTMPSVESIISAAEKISIHSPPLSPLHIQVMNNSIFVNLIMSINITSIII